MSIQSSSVLVINELSEPWVTLISPKATAEILHTYYLLSGVNPRTAISFEHVTKATLSERCLVALNELCSF